MSGTGVTGPRMACNLCRQRKIRCDRAKPACETCHFAGVPCIFAPLPQKKNVREQLEETRAQLQRVEDALKAERESNHSSASAISIGFFDPSGGYEAALAAYRWHLAYCTLGVSPCIRFDSIFDFDDFSRRFSHSLGLPYAPNNSRPNQVTIPNWPPRSLVAQSIEYFSTNRLYSIFPVVDTDVLKNLLSANALDEYGESLDTPHRACLVAFTAFVIRLRRHEPAFAHADANAYMQAVLSMLPQLVMEHTNIRVVEVFVMLGTYLAPMGHPQTAELLLSLALRVLSNLGAHTKREYAQDLGKAKYNAHLRALFWMCYSIDKEMSLRKRQPPLINDADCDLELPAAYVPSTSDHQFFTFQLSAQELLYPSDLRLSLLKSKIYRHLYSHSSLDHSEATRIQLIRELDQELNDLKARFPSACQPEEFTTGGAPENLLLDLSLRGVNVHLEYYHCLAKIHGASVAGGIPITQTPSPISSSMELCYQASRSTLIYIGRVRHLINPDTFWIYAQFILTAVLFLYQRFLTDPAQAYTHGDVRILENVLGIFTQLNHADRANCFPPFVIMEALIRDLLLSGGHR